MFFRTLQRSCRWNIVSSRRLFSTIPEVININLEIRDANVQRILHNYLEKKQEVVDLTVSSKERDELLHTALRIGFSSLEHAQSHFDHTFIQREVDRMLNLQQSTLASHSNHTHSQLQTRLMEYFDPLDGKLEKRLVKLQHDDGDLRQVLNSSVESASKKLLNDVDTLIGPQSNLYTYLDQTNTKSIHNQMKDLQRVYLDNHSKVLLNEFSQDKQDSALKRFLLELETRVQAQDKKNEHMQLSMMKQFSLDDSNSALWRLMKMLEDSSKKSVSELSLDNEYGSLTRLRRELQDITMRQNETLLQMKELVTKEFQLHRGLQEVSKKTPLHGLAYEEYVFHILQQCKLSNGVFDKVGHTTGGIRNCKVGDFLITMNQDHIAAGASIIIETKDAKGYTIKAALEEANIAMKNREADIAMFVYPKHVQNLPDSITREGDVIFVQINTNEEATSQIIMQAAISLCQGLVVRKQMLSKEDSKYAKDLAKSQAKVEKALRDIEKETRALDDSKKLVDTIINSADKLQQKLRLNVKRVQDSQLLIEEELAKLYGVKTKTIRTEETTE